MEKIVLSIILPIILLFIFWYICNEILKNKLKKYNELNDYTIPSELKHF